MADTEIVETAIEAAANAAVASPEIRNLAISLGIALILGAVLLSKFSLMLRDDSGRPDSPYSFARTQLLWWTVVIGLAFVYFFGKHGVMPPINATCLALLGIGAGTTAVAKIIDERQRTEAAQDGVAAPAAAAKSAWFLEDILSDEKGVSVHRFQALFFNASYGLAYLAHVARESKLPEYEPETWSLLGLSSAGYLGLKALENKTPATPPGQSDELIDTAAPSARPPTVG